MLHYIFLILSLFSTGGAYLANSAMSLWWLPLWFVGGYLAWAFFYVLVILVMSAFLPTNKPIEKPSVFCRFMIWLTMDWVMTLLRIKITVKGRELLPSEPCVIVCNHLSGFDPMTVLAVLRERKIAYISKESNFKIPIVGRFIFHAGFLSIDRSNGVRALRTLKVAAERMKETSVDIGIYPEGTRSRTGKLLRFKPGAYVLAKDADAPIAVMSTKGTDLIPKRIPWRSVRVTLEVLEVIPREEVQALTPDELAARSKEIIEISLFGAPQSKEKGGETA